MTPCGPARLDGRQTRDTLEGRLYPSLRAHVSRQAMLGVRAHGRRVPDWSAMLFGLCSSS